MTDVIAVDEGVEEFIARRRSDQERWAEQFADVATMAIDGDHSDAIDAAERIITELWVTETQLPTPNFQPLLEKMSASFVFLTDESDPDRVALWMAVAALNFTSSATAFAQGKGLEWRTMRDSDVREIHREAEGQRVHAGELFFVGGEHLPYPGWPAARPDNYLNCRCVARPVSMDETASLAAGGPMSKHWFGVLAPEGKPSGDGRMFAVGALRNRELPLPLTWQKASSEGHNNSITVATITRVGKVDGEFRGEGDFLDTPEAAEAAGLVEAFGRYGVSVDGTEAVIDGEASTEGLTVFSDANIAGASIVHIPAFAEAYISLGETPADFFAAEGDKGDKPECKCDADECDCPDEMLKDYSFDGFRDVSTDERKRLAKEGKAMDDGSYPIASCSDLENAIQAIGRAKDPEATKRHIRKRKSDLGCDDVELPDTWAAEDLVEAGRGPGWITNPEETRRLHAYWVKGEGAAKIGWGVAGDFNRCRTQLGEEIGENSPEKLRFLNQICAQWHHDALGIWPGEHHGAETEQMAPAFSLTASGDWSDIDSKWFERPTFIRGGVNVDGFHTYGYIAEWGVCHITYPGVCVEAPKSETDYSFFATGTIECSDGTKVPVGSLTIGTGHANEHMSARAAAAHYDNTGTVWAYVAVGEDERGIWYSGIVSPNATEAQVREAMASGRVSGDWRTIRNNLELVAALSVNVAGFPKVAAGIDGTGQISLVAAGISSPEESGDAIEQIADRVVEKIESRVQARRKKEERIKALRSRLGEED